MGLGAWTDSEVLATPGRVADGQPTVCKGRNCESEETEYIGVPRSGSVSVRAAVLRFAQTTRDN